MSAYDKRVLSSNVSDKLKRKIIDGEWKVNEQIPTEQELAEELMVSRTTIREAIKILASQNIVRIDRGKGTFVAETPGVIQDPLGFEFIQEERLIKDLCDYRVAIEPCVCEIAAEKATESQLQKMEEMVLIMEQLEKELLVGEAKNPIVDELAELDAEFHTLLYYMTQNIVFERMIPIVNYMVFENYLTKLYRSRKQRLEASKTHKSLYEAIKNRDKKEAYARCKSHMEIMRDDICKELLK